MWWLFLLVSHVIVFDPNGHTRFRNFHGRLCVLAGLASGERFVDSPERARSTGGIPITMAILIMSVNAAARLA